MSEQPKMTATERLQEEAAKLGVKVEVVEAREGTGTITFLKRREPDEDRSEK